MASPIKGKTAGNKGKTPVSKSKMPSKGKASTTTTAKKPSATKTPTKTPAKPTAPAKKPAASAKKATAATKQPTTPAKKSAVEKKSMPEKKPTAPKKAATTTKKGAPGDLSAPQVLKPYQAERNEEYMNAAQRDHFRHILNQWKLDLMQEVDRTVHHMKDESANLPDPADRATQEEEFSFELRTRDRERKLIKKIEESLETLDRQDYGYCEACGVEIGVRRLEARPTATLCIDCKTLDEIKEKQIKG